MADKSRMRFIEERKRRRWSQQDLADALGATRHTVGRWELGLSTPGPYFRKKLGALYEKSLSELSSLLELADPQLRTDLPVVPVLAQDQPRLLAPLWHVPYHRNPFFTGREEILETIHARFSGSQATPLTHSCAIYGLGGIGKTQLAVEYAYRYRGAYGSILWVEAESQVTLVASFVALADLLALPERAEEAQGQIVAAVLRWLNQHRGWLLILDNVEDLALLKPFLPTGGQGDLLLTTRLRGLATVAHTIEVTPLTLQEGVALLYHRARRSWEDRATPALDAQESACAWQIATAMGGLPLALDQAGAYIDSTQCSYSDYWQLFQSSQLALLDERESASDHPLSVTRTFTLAIEQVEQRDPSAAAMLTACAFLAPDAIPEAFFFERAAHSGEPDEALVADAYHFHAALKPLLAYSLLQRDSTAHVLTIHRLVQVVLRDRLSRPIQAAWITRLIRLLNQVFPDEIVPIMNWPWCEQVLPHALTLLRFFPQRDDQREGASLLNKVAFYLHYRGRDEESERLYQQAIDLQEAMSEADPQEQIASLLGVAEVAWSLRKPPSSLLPLVQRAITLLQRTSADLRLSQSFDLLALVALAEGRLTEAEHLFVRSLAIWIRSILRESTGSDSSSLSAPLQEEPEPDAEDLVKQALFLWSKEPKRRDFPIGRTLTSLSHAYQLQQRYQEAEAILFPLCQISQQVLGEQHPIRSYALIIQAEVDAGQGRLEEAISCFRQALAIREAAYGPHHALTVEARLGFVALLRTMGREEEAM